MASEENSFFGLKVPEGTDRRELYKSQYRAIISSIRNADIPRPSNHLLRGGCPQPPA